MAAIYRAMFPMPKREVLELEFWEMAGMLGMDLVDGPESAGRPQTPFDVNAERVRRAAAGLPPLRPEDVGWGGGGEQVIATMSGLAGGAGEAG